MKKIATIAIAAGAVLLAGCSSSKPELPPITAATVPAPSTFGLATEPEPEAPAPEPEPEAPAPEPEPEWTPAPAPASLMDYDQTIWNMRSYWDMQPEDMRADACANDFYPYIWEDLWDPQAVADFQAQVCTGGAA